MYKQPGGTYTGYTTDVDRRILQHNTKWTNPSPRGRSYTRNPKRQPWELMVSVHNLPTEEIALQLENFVKKMLTRVPYVPNQSRRASCDGGYPIPPGPPYLVKRMLSLISLVRDPYFKHPKKQLSIRIQPAAWGIVHRQWFRDLPPHVRIFWFPRPQSWTARTGGACWDRDLPIGVTTSILCWLTHKDVLGSWVRTCSAWRRLVQGSAGITELQWFQEATSKQTPTQQVAGMLSLVKGYKLYTMTSLIMTSLYPHRCDLPGGKFLFPLIVPLALCTASRQLVRVSLRGCQALEGADQILRAICTPMLRYLDVAFAFARQTPLTTLDYLRRASDLEYLDIRSLCTSQLLSYENGWGAIAALKNLTHLNIADTQVSNETDDTRLWLALGPALVDLTAALPRLALAPKHSFPLLKHLTVSLSRADDYPRLLAQFLNNCRHLLKQTKWTLSECHLEDKSLIHFN